MMLSLRRARLTAWAMWVAGVDDRADRDAARAQPTDLDGPACRDGGRGGALALDISGVRPGRGSTRAFGLSARPCGHRDLICDSGFGSPFQFTRPSRR